MRKIFAEEQMYRYFVQVNNVNDYLVDDYAAEIIDEYNQISGWCSESGRKKVMDHFKSEKGAKFLFVTKEQYYEEYAQQRTA